MKYVKKTGLLALAMLVAVVTFVPAGYSHAATYVVTESQQVVREYTPPPVVVREYTPPATVIHEYTPAPIVREETIVTRPIVREETVVTQAERENRLHSWWERHFREDRD